jgi:hypothetical protein
VIYGIFDGGNGRFLSLPSTIALSHSLLFDAGANLSPRDFSLKGFYFGLDSPIFWCLSRKPFPLSKGSLEHKAPKNIILWALFDLAFSSFSGTMIPRLFRFSF